VSPSCLIFSSIRSCQSFEIQKARHLESLAVWIFLPDLVIQALPYPLRQIWKRLLNLPLEERALGDAFSPHLDMKVDAPFAIESFDEGFYIVAGQNLASAFDALEYFDRIVPVLIVWVLILAVPASLTGKIILETQVELIVLPKRFCYALRLDI